MKASEIELLPEDEQVRVALICIAENLERVAKYLAELLVQLEDIPWLDIGKGMEVS